MRKHLKHFFIPHEGNNYKPLSLHHYTVLTTTLIIVALLFLPFVHNKVISKLDYLAAVLPGVLVDLANADRMKNSLNPVKPNELLQKAAELKAKDMAEKSYFAHNSPEGVTPWYWFGKVGYRFTNAGENLAINFSDSSDVQNAWMASPGHRANILNNNFTEIGIATEEGWYQGQRVVFVVELFGTPAFAAEPFIAIPAEAETEEEPLPQAPIAAAPTPTPTAPEPVEEVKEANVEIVDMKDMFIAVKNTDELVVADEIVPNEPVPAVAASVAEPQSTLFQKIVLSPREMVSFMYVVLAIMVFISLLLAVFVEFEKQHRIHFVYAIGLLLMLSLAFYLNQIGVFTKIAIL